ncbi:uncharacterized protein CLAFUR5_07577 [Fulvia fulva]|uniref:Zn(2)-C6 fungal-type domain-containing protein n=1 Tax=Passalora fulva TaxID=5499 RepID=A0A9Q8LJ09_PASFU|nr:uncharacterized protein CLAFUR5_07577 [Fulvia fulva]UJO18531.1 hypothetical protein CLAFUR5_07577 [Fulvia fulva]WPV30679.1 hypothetical protein CLAFUW7_07450 [Fulvia fulva]
MYHNAFQHWQLPPVAEPQGLVALPQAQWVHYAAPTDCKILLPGDIDTKPYGPTTAADSGLLAYHLASHAPAPDQQASWLPVKVPKKPRAMQACDQCRYRKQRCDEGTPCSFCKELDLECSYRPPVPSKFDKMVDFMASWMSTQSEGLTALSNKLDRLQRVLVSYESNPSLPRSETQGSTFQDQDDQFQQRRRSFGSPTELKATGYESVLQWPAVRDVLARANVFPNDDYLLEAEDHTQPLPGSSSASSWPHNYTLQVDKIKSEYGAFLDHVYGRHPIINRCSVAKTLEGFTTERRRTPSAGYHQDERPAKRRRLDTQSPMRPDTPEIRQSPSTAVALLVLALGAAVESEVNHSKGLHHRAYNHDQKHWASDAVPGFSHYTEAVQIMAGHMDGTSLAHAQMFLLAGLYKARLVRTREASSWYSMAGRVLLHLVQRRQLHKEQRHNSSSTPQGDRSTQVQHNSQDDLVLRCAWSCLSLEGQILPDLRLPKSGLEQIEYRLPLPSSVAGIAANNGETALARGSQQERRVHAAHLRLRRLSHELNRSLLSHSSGDTPPDLASFSSKQSATLERWRSTLPSSLQWHDTDTTPHGAAIASLGHAYWRAKLSLTRPFLDYVLHRHHTSEAHDEYTASMARDHAAEIPQMRSTIAALRDTAGYEDVLELAHSCIEATKQSVTFRDFITESWVVDNVQTLSHQRVEDVLLLAAAHQHDELRGFVPLPELQQLTSSAVGLLQQHSGESPACAADYNILLGFQQANFGLE